MKVDLSIMFTVPLNCYYKVQLFVLLVNGDLYIDGGSADLSSQLGQYGSIPG